MDVQTKEALAMDGPLPADLCLWWEDFLKGEPRHGSKAIGDLFASGLCPLQRRREMVRMMEASCDNPSLHPATVMSIGTDKGGDIYAWLKLVPVKNFIACEIRGLPYADLLEKAFPRVDFLWLPASSYASDTIGIVQRWLGLRKIDAIFLDGDKSYFDFDFACYLPLLSPGAVALFHDIQDEAPGAAWQRVLDRHKGVIARHEEIIDTSEVGPALAKPPGERTAYENWLAHWHGRSCGVGVIHLK